MGRAARRSAYSRPRFLRSRSPRLESRCGDAALRGRHRDGLRITSAVRRGFAITAHAPCLLRCRRGGGGDAPSMRGGPMIAHLNDLHSWRRSATSRPGAVSRCKSHAGAHRGGGWIRDRAGAAATPTALPAQPTTTSSSLSGLPDAPEGLEIHELMVEPYAFAVRAGAASSVAARSTCRRWPTPLSAWCAYGTQRRPSGKDDRRGTLTRLALSTFPQTLDFDGLRWVLEMVGGPGMGDPPRRSRLLHRARAARRRRDAGLALRRFFSRHIALAAKSGRIGRSGRAYASAVPGPHRDPRSPRGSRRSPPRSPKTVSSSRADSKPHGPPCNDSSTWARVFCRLRQARGALAAVYAATANPLAGNRDARHERRAAPAPSLVPPRTARPSAPPSPPLRAPAARLHRLLKPLRLRKIFRIWHGRCKAAFRPTPRDGSAYAGRRDEDRTSEQRKGPTMSRYDGHITPRPALDPRGRRADPGRRRRPRRTGAGPDAAVNIAVTETIASQNPYRGFPWR